MPLYPTMLPFPRGKTYTQGAFDPDDHLTENENLEGFLCSVPNPDYPGEEILLRVVRYVDADGDPLTGAPKVVEFDSGELGREITGYADAAGAVGKPLDPMYNGVTIEANDLVYVIEAGKVTLTKESGVAISEGDLVLSNNAGAITNTGTGCVIGVAVKAAEAAATTVVVDVFPGVSTRKTA